jgi:hypothetical protein
MKKKNTTTKKMWHIYIFDYTNVQIYHDLIEEGKDYIEYYEEHDMSEDQYHCMVSPRPLYINDLSSSSSNFS